MEAEKTAPEAVRPVAAARIDFTAEDRAWIAERIQEVLASGQLTLGRFGADFERAFASLCGTKHAVAVNSGTSALEIILRSLGVAGGEVIVPTNTFFATAAAVVHAGGRPVLADVEPATMSLSAEDTERRLTSKTRGIVVVHIGGVISAEMPALLDLARRKGLWLVEDAAHAHGSIRSGVRAGAFGVAAAFSFYPTKVMTSAEGGMIVTNDAHLDQEARIYRDQGKASFTQNAHTRMGYNWRMSEPHAIIGLRHLQRLPAMIAERQRIAAGYDAALREFSRCRPLAVPNQDGSNYYKYVAFLSQGVDRAAVKRQMKERFQVSLAGEVYDTPLHAQPIFREMSTGGLPVAEDVCARHVCLPVYTGMQEQDVHRVLAGLREIVG
jgi:dTDP-4-amino-4,6-dideoxygalactose transaminase